MRRKKRALLALIVAIIIAAVFYSQYNKAQSHMLAACWSPTTPGDQNQTQGLWSKNSDGSYTKIEDWDGWITLASWQVEPGDNCNFPNGWRQ